MPDSFDEAFPGGFEECVRTLSQEPEVDDAERLCGWLQENGFEALSEESGVTDVLLNLDVEYVSVVDEPAQDSEWLLAKSEDADADEFDPSESRLRSSSILLKQEEDEDDDTDDEDDDEEEQKVWAAVLEPETADKQGDLIPRPEIEETAHKYLKRYRKVDSDHDLAEGAGVPIESYIIRDGPETFDLPDGGSKTYPPGTWIMGVELSADAWDRVKSGELSGFSIYGGATSLDPATLLTEDQRAALSAVRSVRGDVAKQVEPAELSFGSRETASLVAEAFGLDGTHERDDGYGYMPGEDHSRLVSFLDRVNENMDGDDEDDGDGEPEADSYDSGDDDPDEEEDDDEEKQEWKDDENPCWDGYVMVGTKIDENGNEVPRCVPEEEVEESEKDRDTENSSMGDNSDENGDGEQDAKLDELLEKTDNIGENVEEVQKSVSDLNDRVDTLEEWRKSVVGEADEGGDDEDDPDGEGATLDEEEVEDIATEVAEDAAETGAEKALCKFLDLDELPDDEDERKAVVRKGVRSIGGAEETGDSETIDVSNEGILSEEA
jgi:hypothetical protein